MRRICAVFLCLLMLPLPVRGARVKYAALTFDDGPSGKYTRQLLDGLAQRGVQATFLLCGYRIKDDPDLTQRIFDEGHEIGLHGYSHKSMEYMSRREIAAEITDTQALLPEGCRPVFLRPPGGLYGDGVRQVAEARGLAILRWSVDPKDWAMHDPDAIQKAVMTRVKDGDIILLHDMSVSSVQAALSIVDALHEEGFQLVTVSELARLRSLRPKPGHVYTRFPDKEENLK